MSIAVGQHGLATVNSGVTFGSAMTAGDSMVLALFNTASTHTLSSITVTDGSNPLTISVFDTSVSSSATGVLYLAHIDNAAHAYTSVSASWSVGGGNGGVGYIEVSGLSSSSLDQINQGSALTSLSLSTGTLSVPDEIIVTAAAKAATTAFGTPPNYTITDQAQIGPSWRLALAYRIVSATTSTSVSWSFGSSVAGEAVLGTYEQAAAGVEQPPILVPSRAQQAVVRSSVW